MAALNLSGAVRELQGGVFFSRVRFLGDSIVNHGERGGARRRFSVAGGSARLRRALSSGPALGVRRGYVNASERIEMPWSNLRVGAKRWARNARATREIGKTETKNSWRFPERLLLPPTAGCSAFSAPSAVNALHRLTRSGSRSSQSNAKQPTLFTDQREAVSAPTSPTEAASASPTNCSRQSSRLRRWGEFRRPD